MPFSLVVLLAVLPSVSHVVKLGALTAPFASCDLGEGVPACQSSRSVWITLSHIGSDFWVVPRGARSWI